MEPNARRQLKDIQSRAERLLTGRPTMNEIEEYHQYNEELKNYLLNNLKEPALLDRVKQIPQILNESNSQAATRGIFSAFLMIFASVLVTYFENRQRIENAKENIREARGKYASIEFLSRNSR